MPRITPIATYALAIILVLWVLLGAITLPNAGRWFKGSGYKIENGKCASIHLIKCILFFLLMTYH